MVGVSDLLNGKYILVQKGKKNYFLVKLPRLLTTIGTIEH